MKLSPVATHPVSPFTDQVPVIDPPERVVPLAVPVTVPLSVRVLFPDCTLYVKVPVTALVLVLVLKTIEPVWLPPETGKQVPAVRN